MIPKTSAAMLRRVRSFLALMIEHINPIMDRTIVLIKTAKELVGLKYSTTRNAHT